jgi:hypothetical protein
MALWFRKTVAPYPSRDSTDGQGSRDDLTRDLETVTPLTADPPLEQRSGAAKATIGGGAAHLQEWLARGH